MKIQKSVKLASYGYSNQKGITLISLMITIIVVAILGGVTVSQLISEDGIVEKARTAAKLAEEDSILEQIQLESVYNSNGTIDVEKTIENIQEKFGANVTIGDDGIVSITGENGTFKFSITDKEIAKVESDEEDDKDDEDLPEY